jgi:hypothetical protein
MRNQDFHVPDQDLLLLADGELPARRSLEVRSHLEACWSCRARVQQLEAVIADFVHLHHSRLDPHVPPAAGPRALLKARLAEAAAASPRGMWLDGLRFVRSFRAWSYAFMVLLTVGLLALAQRELRPTPAAGVRDGSAPNRELTPGKTRAVTWDQVCSDGYRDMNRAVPPAVERQVFKEYGIPGTRGKDYEVDYLITPELGGTDDLQNLWPEPYSSTEWGAHVKDALEDRLHQMVCEKKIDLGTAQREMARDWISAYKKYFHTDKPQSIDSANPAEKSQSETGSSKSTKV